MTFVLDASVTLSWFFNEAGTNQGLLVRDRLAVERAVVPALWLYEVANVLTIAAGRGRLSQEVVSDCAGILASLPVDIAEPARDMTAVMDLASRHSLTVYDAAYLHVALQAGLDLATLDGSLGQAARDAGVTLVLDSSQPG